MRRLKLTGMFGRLKVIKFDGSKKGRSYWECKCSCGNVVVIIGRDLVSGGTQSCGCLQKEIVTGKNSCRYNPNLTNTDRIKRRHVPGYKERKKQLRILNIG